MDGAVRKGGNTHGTRRRPLATAQHVARRLYSRTRIPWRCGFVVRAMWACQKGSCASDVMKGAMGEAGRTGRS